MADAALWSLMFESDSGPVIALPSDLLHIWYGMDHRPGAAADTPSDYDRACQAKGSVMWLPVVSEKCVVVGAKDSVDGAHWLRLNNIIGIE